jgi:hypothetical protein
MVFKDDKSYTSMIFPRTNLYNLKYKEEYIMDSKSPWYLKKSPLGAAYQHFSNVAKQQTVLDAKTKELI